MSGQAGRYQRSAAGMVGAMIVLVLVVIGWVLFREFVREVPATPAKEAHTSAELLEKITGTAVDSPLCFTCGTKMRPAGSCYVCEGCGSTSGCS